MVSFELGIEIEKDVFSACHERGAKKKSRVPIRNRNSDLRIPRSDALPLSHRDSTVSEVYYEVHMTRVLHTADEVHENFVIDHAHRGVSVAQW